MFVVGLWFCFPLNVSVQVGCDGALGKPVLVEMCPQIEN